MRSASLRKLGKDGNSLTPTEQRKKNQLMRQFMRNPEGSLNTEAYRAGYDAMTCPKCNRLRKPTCERGECVQ